MNINIIFSALINHINTSMKDPLFSCQYYCYNSNRNIINILVFKYDITSQAKQTI